MNRSEQGTDSPFCPPPFIKVSVSFVISEQLPTPLVQNIGIGQEGDLSNNIKIKNYTRLFQELNKKF